MTSVSPGVACSDFLSSSAGVSYDKVIAVLSEKYICAKLQVSGVLVLVSLSDPLSGRTGAAHETAVACCKFRAPLQSKKLKPQKGQQLF